MIETNSACGRVLLSRPGSAAATTALGVIHENQNVDEAGIDFHERSSDITITACTVNPQKSMLLWRLIDRHTRGTHHRRPNRRDQDPGTRDAAASLPLGRAWTAITSSILLLSSEL